MSDIFRNISEIFFGRSFGSIIKNRSGFLYKATGFPENEYAVLAVRATA